MPIRRLAGAFPARLPRTVVAITHDRYFLDNVAGWILELDRGAAASPSRATTPQWLESKGQPSGLKSKQESSHSKGDESRTGMGRQGAKGRQIQIQGRLQRFEELQNPGVQKRSRRPTRNLYPPAPPGDRFMSSTTSQG